MSSQEYGNSAIKDLIDQHLEEFPDFDSHALRLGHLKVDMTHFVEDVDCIDADGEVNSGSELFKKEGKLEGFRGCNDRAMKCCMEIKQLEVTLQSRTSSQASVNKLLGEGAMALWFTSQIEFLKVTLKEGFFNLIYDMHEKEVEQMAKGERIRLTERTGSPLPERYCR
jgi:hypothetical protein